MAQVNLGEQEPPQVFQGYGTHKDINPAAVTSERCLWSISAWKRCLHRGGFSAVLLCIAIHPGVTQTSHAAGTDLVVLLLSATEFCSRQAVTSALHSTAHF